MFVRSARYAPCPGCGALNLLHREQCYKCHRPLPDGCAPNPSTGSSPGVRHGHMKLDDLRRDTRRAILLYGVVMEIDGGGQCRGSVRNISQGGARFVTLAECRAGQAIRLHLPFEGRIWQIAGEIRYVRPVLEGGMQAFTCGIRFRSLPPDLKELIQRLIMSAG